MISLIGSNVASEERWRNGVVIGEGTGEPVEEWEVYNRLVPLGNDPQFTSNLIVIPAGRLVGIYPNGKTFTGKAQLTLADGVDVKPSGFARSHMYQKPPNRHQSFPLLSRACTIEVPYVDAINGAYGALYGGTPITAFYGSVSETVKVPNHVGKIVKWVGRTLYNVHQAAGTECTLTAANLSGLRPTIVLAMNAGTVVATGASCVPTWDSTNDVWVATFGNPVTDVLYTFGQGPEMIAGEVLRVEPISSSHELSGWLKWVTTGYSDPLTAQLARPVPTTAVSSETPSAVSTGVYQLAHYPVAGWKPITITVTGSLLNPDGTTTTLTSTEMSAASLPYADYTRGMYYTVDALTGRLTFSSNVTVSSVTVSYYYETSYRYGAAFGQGQPGLTDGEFTGVPGTPGRLEVAGCVGALRCLIY